MEFDSLVGALLEIAIILLGFSLCVLDLIWYRRHKDDIWRWVKLCYAVAGLFWAGIYIYVLIENYHVASTIMVWVRIGIAGTLGLMNVGAALRLQLDNYVKHRLED